MTKRQVEEASGVDGGTLSNHQGFRNFHLPTLPRCNGKNGGCTLSICSVLNFVVAKLKDPPFSPFPLWVVGSAAANGFTSGEFFAFIE